MTRFLPAFDVYQTPRVNSQRVSNITLLRCYIEEIYLRRPEVHASGGNIVTQYDMHASGPICHYYLHPRYASKYGT